MATIVTLTPNPALDLWTTTDRFRAGPKLRCAPPQLHPGGGGINVSRVVHRLGGETLALYAAGGRTGRELAEAVEAEDVPSESVSVPGQTREVFNVCESASGDVMRFVTPGPDFGEKEAGALVDLLEQNVSSGSLVVGSGSLPPQVPSDFWGRAAGICRKAGGRFLLDSHDGVEAALSEGIYLFRETGDAMREIAGENLEWPGGVAERAGRMIDLGEAEAVIVTEGAEGALLVTNGERCVQSPPAGIKVKSAIGAGDSFMGGLCLAIARGKDWREALRHGVAAAAATLLTPGTELCREEDVERLLGECRPPRRI